ncbi:MAG: ATP-binding protein [Deltaproteobacteria bacterium]|nr:ATP-binding protein [Deltaproteobacteria bacterium]
MQANRPETPEQLKEQRKRRRERALIAITLVLVVAITSLEVHLVHQGGQPVTGSLLAFGLLNINTFLLLLFTFLIFRHLSKLFLERRRKVFGSRLRTRLVLSFISLTLLPTLFLFFMAWQLIGSRVDHSWDRQVEESLDKAIDLTRTFSLDLEDNLRAYGRMFGQELQEQDHWTTGDRDFFQSFADRNRSAYHLSGLEVFDVHQTPLATSYDPRLGQLPGLPAPEPGAALPPDAVIRQKVGADEVLSLQVPVNDTAGDLKGYLLVRKRLPKTHLLRIAEATRNLQELRQRQLQLSPVKVSHYLALIIVTLIAMMAAIWLGFYMAREITTPIRQLAEGTVKVAGGNYDIHIDQEGRDEIGFLVQSFNKMTQDLQQSQAQLAAAYRQLSQSHELISTQKRDMEILLKNVAAGVIGLDAAGRVTLINDSAAQMLHLNREDVLGREAKVLLPPAEYSRMAEVVAAARRAARGTVERPLHLVLPNQTLYLLLKTTVLKDEAGGDLGVVIVFEDLTELERAQRLAAWREVARRIAHEVKNPLTPIKLAAQRLQRRYAERLGEDDQVFQECTQIIVNQVDELKNLVNAFSRFAKLPQLTLMPQDLNALVQETVLLYQELQPRVALEFHPDPQLPPLLLDREQVKRLLLNLLDNALASIDGAGKITVSLRRHPADGRVELTVADTGRGVPDRDKVRIFEPYFSTKRGGTGLGLAIVNSIVAEHQGHIRVENNLPRGAKFIIDLPLHRAEYAGKLAGS